MDSQDYIRRIGAMAEAASVFYNAISAKVPKDVALSLTMHFMDMTSGKQAVRITPAQLAAIAEAKRRELEKKQPPRAERPEQPKDEEETEAKPPEETNAPEPPEG